jgi:hypothetical protein
MKTETERPNTEANGGEPSRLQSAHLVATVAELREHSPMHAERHDRRSPAPLSSIDRGIKTRCGAW